MTFTRLVLISILYSIVSCSFNQNNYEMNDYLLAYIDENFRTEIDLNNANIVLVYTDRCKSCSSENLSILVDIAKQKNVTFIQNYKNEELELKYKNYANKILIDNKNFEKYGLVLSENTIFIIRNGIVKYSNSVNINNRKKILKNLNRN